MASPSPPYTSTSPPPPINSIFFFLQNQSWQGRKVGEERGWGKIILKVCYVTTVMGHEVPFSGLGGCLMLVLSITGALKCSLFVFV